MNEQVELAAGQIWKDRRRSSKSVFFITRVYEKLYSDGNTRQRVTGILASSDARQDLQIDRDLDSESLRKMFPYPLFIPTEPYEPEETK